MTRYAVFLALASVTAANAASFLGAPANSMDSMRGQVERSEVFQSKVAALCEHAPDQAKCRVKATDALFCQLLQRSKPDVAKGYCAPKRHATALLQTVAPKARMEDMKMRIEGTSAFKEETSKMASTLGCSGMKKSANCAAYVQDLAFCLAFADQMGKFRNLDGVKEQRDHCKHVDKKMPDLAMFLQSQFSFAQISSHHQKAPEDELAKEMTHDLEMNFNKIAPFGKEDTAKELQDHAAKTQDTLVDAVENAEVAEIKRAVFRALTRLRAATIKEFDTIARLETQAIDAYNDAHHYRAENPLAHLHEDEAPVATDKLKSFH